jgi:hypothetical protein
MAQTLEATGDYRVIRRLKPRPSNMPSPATPVRLGMVVDVETTGLDPQRDEIDVPLSFHPAATRVLGLVTPRSVG